MKVKLLLLFGIIWTTGIYSQDLSSSRLDGTSELIKDYDSTPLKTNIVKLAPALAGPYLKGFIASYETGTGISNVSLNLSFKYYAGSDTTETANPKNSHTRIEVFPRFYPRHFINGPYFGPLFSIYDNGEASLGAMLGYQTLFKNRVSLDAFIGLQSSNEIENLDDPAPIFPRLGFNIGYLFYINETRGEE